MPAATSAGVAPGSSFDFNQGLGPLALAPILRITPFSNSSLNRSAETPINVGCRPFRAPPAYSAAAEDVFDFVEEAFVVANACHALSEALI